MYEYFEKSSTLAYQNKLDLELLEIHIHEY